MEKNIGKQGIKAVKAPAGVAPSPIEAVSRSEARVQLRESIPWL